ncbi:MAG TPA: arylamine N-acetyltransferase [Usitatibacter sp.]|nr:arylamine N-acetyltransferase [Usitatibacter sp.]
MEPTSLDLEAYFARVGHAGGARPDLANLTALHALHAAAIPFENLAPLLGEPVKLDIASLQEKLVARRRGGWCFEHNLLFAHVLRAMGYRLKTLAARVRWNVSPGVTTARSHCLLLLEIEGQRYISDVGFGGLSLTAPLELRPGVEQATPHEPHRVVEEGEGYGLEAKIGGEWQRLYNFDLHEQLQADYEVSNWYLGHFPQSQFVTGLICARAAPEMRHALRNTRYAVHHRGGLTERRFITRLDDLKGVLREAMRIPLPESAKLDAALQRVLDLNPPASDPASA